MQNDSLRRLMRRIALGLPFAVPVLTAPFNVGGCYPLGYRCPETPVRELIVHAAPADEPLDCAEVCERDVTCERADDTHVACYYLVPDCPPAGRRPARGLRASRAPSDPAAAWLHRVAALEAASVIAFEELAADLRALGAPQALVRRAEEARADEVRHARVVAALASRRGAPAVRVEVPRAPRRALAALAEDNAVEGCVREAWGALEAGVQARAATAPDVRAAMATIARDEARHALLSLDLDGWAREGLDADDRRRLDEAADAARLELREELARRAPVPELGLVPGPDAVALFDAALA